MDENKNTELKDYIVPTDQITDDEPDTVLVIIEQLRSVALVFLIALAFMPLITGIVAVFTSLDAQTRQYAPFVTISNSFYVAPFAVVAVLTNTFANRRFKKSAITSTVMLYGISLLVSASGIVVLTLAMFSNINL